MPPVLSSQTLGDRRPWPNLRRPFTVILCSSQDQHAWTLREQELGGQQSWEQPQRPHTGDVNGLRALGRPRPRCLPEAKLPSKQVCLKKAKHNTQVTAAFPHVQHAGGELCLGSPPGAKLALQGWEDAQRWL